MATPFYEVIENVSAISPSSPIHLLPEEILDEIIQSTPLRDLLNLCRVSKRWHALTISYLYQFVRLATSGSLLRISRTLESSVRIAATVKTLEIAVESSTLEPSTIQSALNNLIFLETLKFSLPGSDSLEKCTLPSLTYLQASANHSFPWRISPSPTFVSPEPQTFLGKCCLYSTGRARLYFAANRQSSMEWNQRRPEGWNLDLLAMVSHSLPDLALLDLTNVLIMETFPPQDVLDAIETLLARFNRLQKFFFRCNLHNHLEVDFERDSERVTLWGNACPTLLEIQLPGGPKYVRVHEDLWLPDPDDAGGVKWFDEKMKVNREWRKQVKLALQESAKEEFFNQPNVLGPAFCSLVEAYD
ncbi:hypothetical protein C8J56DRAFT_1047717 [Mycena floridula]|nr:hypothetical protein C8J56DRAFT_1047717 [Mycena floridula]